MRPAFTTLIPVGQRHRLLLVRGHHHEGDAQRLLDVISSNCISSRSCLSSAPSGSSSSSSLGCLTSAREGDALALAAGKLMRLAAREGCELDQIENRGDLAVDLRCRGALLPQPERDIVVHRHVGEQRIGLGTSC